MCIAQCVMHNNPGAAWSTSEQHQDSELIPQRNQSFLKLSYKLGIRNNRIRKPSKPIPLSCKTLFNSLPYPHTKILQNQFELLALHMEAFLLPSDPNRVPPCKPLACGRQRIYSIPSSLFAAQHNVAVY